MERNISLIAALVLIFSVGSQTGAVAQEGSAKKAAKVKTEKPAGKKLFNGKNLKNWEFMLKDESVNPADVFTVQDGVIHIKGDPFGYMRTSKEYSDYALHVEWRWPVEATNSGVFVHGQQPDTIWLQCIECQLSAGNAGDFVCMNGADINERTDKSTRVVRKMNSSSEKPVGEWNTMNIVCLGDSIEVTVNGILQNRGTGLTVTGGHICLQSEGKDIEFRNVYLKKAKKQKEKKQA
ncbi:MAG: DUF1080 domain-containing protein [Bacteroidales bacterium]|jgi:hypothetical protein|nr:DUF1080 domain-containing protein [Bacteroidales bacterium]